MSNFKKYFKPEYRADFLTAVSRGIIPGASIVHKFGRNPAMDTGVPEDLWSYGGLYTFSSSAVTLYISSSHNSDTVSINVQGLDANWDIQTVSVTLVGQTKTAIPSVTWRRVFRAYNESGTDLQGDVYIYEDDTTTTPGVPDTAAKVRAKIDLAHQQTLMAIYTVPAGYSAYMLSFWFDGNRLTGAAVLATDMVVQVRPFGGVFLTKHTTGWHSYGGHINHTFGVPQRFTEKSDIKIYLAEASGASDVSGGFDLLLLED
jgi:hypothetical protein